LTCRSQHPPTGMQSPKKKRGHHQRASPKGMTVSISGWRSPGIMKGRSFHLQYLISPGHLRQRTSNGKT
jgi:hypothetical protein